jgi:hypothetical protein
MHATNHYHILQRLPAIEAWEMPPLLEQQARQLVESGRLRINADYERNFVRHVSGETDLCFTERELTDPILLLRTKTALAKSVPRGMGPMAVNSLITDLLKEMKKARGIDPEREMRIARLMVQATHPAVIATLLRESTEMFVSYSHNVSDLMALHFWQTHGTASGMQTSCDTGAAVYVSCGGDPFFEGDPKNKTYATDGFPSLARLMIIAGQELGHYADLRRDPNYGIVGRFSAHLDRLRPTEPYKRARDRDIARVQAFHHMLAKRGFAALLKAEHGVAFFSKRLKYTPPWILAQLWRFACWLSFTVRTIALPLPPYTHTTPYLRCGEYYHTLLADMAFNLAPEADAYRRSNPVHEEAIACIEALARVPQQVHKWGHEVTALCMADLYRLYYGEVIPALESALSPNLRKQLPTAHRLPLHRLMLKYVRQSFRKRPDFLR